MCPQQLQQSRRTNVNTTHEMQQWPSCHGASDDAPACNRTFASVAGLLCGHVRHNRIAKVSGHESCRILSKSSGTFSFGLHPQELRCAVWAKLMMCLPLTQEKTLWIPRANRPQNQMHCHRCDQKLMPLDVFSLQPCLPDKTMNHPPTRNQMEHRMAPTFVDCTDSNIDEAGDTRCWSERCAACERRSCATVGAPHHQAGYGTWMVPSRSRSCCVRASEHLMCRSTTCADILCGSPTRQT